MKRGTEDHPKTLDLADRLNLASWMAVGLLESLWLWTAKFCPRGDIGRYSDSMIARGIGWREVDGTPDQLIRALLESHWLDDNDPHRLIVHDWHDHADDQVQMKVARSKQTFASGAVPKMPKCDNKERQELEKFYAGKIRVPEVPGRSRSGTSGSLPCSLPLPLPCSLPLPLETTLVPEGTAPPAVSDQKDQQPCDSPQASGLTTGTAKSGLKTTEKNFLQAASPPPEFALSVDLATARGSPKESERSPASLSAEIYEHYRTGYKVKRPQCVECLVRRFKSCRTYAEKLLKFEALLTLTKRYVASPSGQSRWCVNSDTFFKSKIEEDDPESWDTNRDERTTRTPGGFVTDAYVEELRAAERDFAASATRPDAISTVYDGPPDFIQSEAAVPEYVPESDSMADADSWRDGDG